MIVRGIRLVVLLLLLSARPSGAGLPLAPTSDPDTSLVLPGLPIEVDSFGNVLVRFGSGRPLTLIAVRRDVPAYFVTSITADGYLRLQSQGASPSPLWDQFHVGRRVFVSTKDGRVLPGVVAAPNTHFRRGDDVPIPEATVDDLWVDVGAESEAEARRMGIEELSVVSQVGNVSAETPLRWIGPGASLVMASHTAVGIKEMLLEDASGSVLLAWVAQGSAGGRGAEALARQLRPDRAVVLGTYVPISDSAFREQERKSWLSATFVDSAKVSQSGWVRTLLERLGARVGEARPDPAATAMGRAGVPVLQLGIVSRYSGSPGELNAFVPPMWAEADRTTLLLGMSRTTALRPISSWPPSTHAAETHRTTWGVLAPLVHAQGISEHEGDVRDTVLRLIPASLRPAVDGFGNVVVRWGTGKPRRAFLAHMDEIGYLVTGVDADGRLRVEKKGGFYDWLYEGEIVRRGDGRLAVVAPRADYLVRPRPVIDSPLSDRRRTRPPGYRGFPDSLVRVDPGNFTRQESEEWIGMQLTVEKNLARMGPHRVAGRSLDDRFGCTALILALKELARSSPPRDGSVLFVFTVEEETGLRGAEKLADLLAAGGELPPWVHAVDTFVSSDTPLEDPRYGGAKLGKGAVIRAVDTGSAAPKAAVDEVRRLAARRGIPLQFGVTSGGNDGQPFALRGSINVPLAWPLRYSHTQVETADLRDLEALASLVLELAKIPPPTR